MEPFVRGAETEIQTQIQEKKHIPEEWTTFVYEPPGVLLLQLKCLPFGRDTGSPAIKMGCTESTADIPAPLFVLGEHNQI